MLLAVTGMQREAKLLHGRCEVIVAGSDNSTLASEIECAIKPETRALLSFGICGALSLDLAVGNLVAGTEVISGNGRWPTDKAWANTLAGACNAITGTVAGTDSVLLSAAAKSALRQETGALAADMESHIVARVASERMLPFAVLRAVSDDAHNALPPAAAFGLKKDGRIDYSAVLLSVLDEPSQIPALIRTARNTNSALGALWGCFRRLGPSFGCLTWL